MGDRLRAGKELALFRADLKEREGARRVQENLTGMELGLVAGEQAKAADLDDQATQLQTDAFGVLSDFGKQLVSSQNPFDRPQGVTQSKVDPNVTFNESALQAQILTPSNPNFGTPDLNPITQPQIIKQPEIFKPLNPFEFAGIQGNTAVA